MIEILFENKDTVQFNAFNMVEMRTEILSRKTSSNISLGDMLRSMEKKRKQKEIAKSLNVSPRFLRYVKTGKRLGKDVKPIGKFKTGKMTGLRSKIINMYKKSGGSLSGGFESGQIRPFCYLDFICEKEGEIIKDMHTEFYSHITHTIREINNKGLHQVIVNEWRDSVQTMCIEGSYCEDIKLYRRGNSHPNKPIYCQECGEIFIAADNKRMAYNVIMKK